MLTYNVYEGKISMVDMVQLNVRLPKKVKEEARECVRQYGYTNLSELVREAIRSHIYALERVKKKR